MTLVPLAIVVFLSAVFFAMALGTMLLDWMIDG